MSTARHGDAAGTHTRLLLRAMRTADMAEVMAVERAAFSSGWSPTAFERELTHNTMARYLVLERGAGNETRIAGYAGLWLMVDEAHVVTVAVLPEHRGRGYGRLLVHGLIGVARDHGMVAATLECRLSNTAALRLYGRYGFYEVGLRKRYYSDNQEDAVVMTTEDISGSAYSDRLAQLESELLVRLPGVSTTVLEEVEG